MKLVSIQHLAKVQQSENSLDEACMRKRDGWAGESRRAMLLVCTLHAVSLALRPAVVGSAAAKESGRLTERAGVIKTTTTDRAPPTTEKHGLDCMDG